jgi:hypothetical protein
LQFDDGSVYHCERHENVSGIVHDKYCEFDGTE